MKTIGIIGGMSFESTIEYYRIINEEINRNLGCLHSAKMLIESYDFDLIEKLQSEGKWDDLGEILSKSAKKLENAGADYIAIATNTMHLCAETVQKNITVPLIHIAEAAANYIKSKNIDTVALLGTKYTMTKPFYKDKLQDFGINVVVPEADEMNIINSIIFNELCIGKIEDVSRSKILKIIEKCASKGAKAVVLGCTELPNIIKEEDVSNILTCDATAGTLKLEIIDTTLIHCLEIVKRMLS